MSISSMAGNWRVDFIDDESKGKQTVAFNSRAEADRWIDSQSIQEKYDYSGFKVIDGPYKVVNGDIVNEGTWPRPFLWIDEIRPAPSGYVWLKSFDEFEDYLVEHGLSGIAVFDIGCSCQTKDCSDDCLCCKCLDYLQSIGADGISLRVHAACKACKQNIFKAIEKNQWTAAQDDVQAGLDLEDQVQALFDDVPEECIDGLDGECERLSKNAVAYKTMLAAVDKGTTSLMDVSAAIDESYYIACLHLSASKHSQAEIVQSISRMVGHMLHSGCNRVWLVDYVDDERGTLMLKVGFYMLSSPFTSDGNVLHEAEDRDTKARIVSALKDLRKKFKDLASNNNPEMFADIVVRFDDLASAVGSYDFKEKRVLKEIDAEEDVEAK